MEYRLLPRLNAMMAINEPMIGTQWFDIKGDITGKVLEGLRSVACGRSATLLLLGLFRRSVGMTNKALRIDQSQSLAATSV